MSIPRVLIAGLRGGSGKTLISLGLVAAWRKKGLSVASFKKGPDYVDAAWLSMAADKPCRNLDLFLMSPQTVVRSFTASAGHADVAVIEGNRGLFDGMDAQGTCSAAELAILLKSPVILAVDCTKSTRTVAACVLGCQQLDSRVPIRGVILNQTAGPRHEAVLREAIEQICGLPVLGAIARIPQQLFPERHLGLVPPQEHDQLASALQQVAALTEQYVDLKAVWNLAREAPALELDDEGPPAQSGSKPEVARIGVFRDTAFQFYYPENLEALTREGASLIEISPLRDAELPDVDALYIGGGFPETQAPALAKNGEFLGSLRRSIERGLPVYAECGGAVFLGEKLLVDQKQYPMAGVLPVVFVFRTKPPGHGYTMLETVENNPFFPVGDSLRGHEFHYTCMQSSAAKDLTFAFRVRRGYGFDGQRDGLCYRNVLASYTHLHALGTESWAPSIVRAAIRFKNSRVDRHPASQETGASLLPAPRKLNAPAEEADAPIGSLVMVGMSRRGRLGSGQGPDVAHTDADEFRKIKSPRCDVPNLLRAACQSGVVREALLWNTCQRFEFYGWMKSTTGDAERTEMVSNVRHQLFSHNGQGGDPAVNVLHGADAWHCLMRSAAGLNSGLPGEREVLQQLHGARRLAERAGTAGPLMDRLVAGVSERERLLRKQTEWGRFEPDYCYASISQIVQSAGLDLPNCRCLVVGGSITSCGILEALAERFGVSRRQLTLLHRGHGHGGHLKMLRKAIGNGRRIRVHKYDEKSVIRAFADADVVFFGLDRKEPVLDAEQIRGCRNFTVRPLAIIDFNMFGSTIGMEDLAGIRLWTAEDLENAVTAFAEEMCQGEQFAQAAVAAESWIRDHVPASLAVGGTCR